MSNRIYVRNYDTGPDVEIDAEDSVIFERDGIPIRVYFDQNGELKVSADERVTISPEASNVFMVRSSIPLDRLVARRVRKAIGQGAEISTDDVRDLVEAVLR